MKPDPEESMWCHSVFGKFKNEQSQTIKIETRRRIPLEVGTDCREPGERFGDHILFLDLDMFAL